MDRKYNEIYKNLDEIKTNIEEWQSYTKMLGNENALSDRLLEKVFENAEKTNKIYESQFNDNPKIQFYDFKGE